MRQTLISTEQFSGFLYIGIYRIYQHFPLPCYKSLSSSSHIARRTFGLGTAWQEALARRKEAYTPAKRREKRFAHLYHLLSEFVQIAEILQKHIFPGASVEIYCKNMFFSGSQWKDPGCMVQWFTSWTKERLRYYLKSITTNPSTANYWAKIYLFFRTPPLWSSCSCSILIRAI